MQIFYLLGRKSHFCSSAIYGHVSITFVVVKKEFELIKNLPVIDENVLDVSAPETKTFTLAWERHQTRQGAIHVPTRHFLHGFQ